MNNYFIPTDILVPNIGINHTKFSVVACDQYTSEPEYWNRVKELTSNVFSTYHLVFPEIYLNKGDFNAHIEKINDSMNEYFDNQVFTLFSNTMIYVERTLRNGAVRRGIVGAIDLEDYDYQKGSQSAIRATEGTVLERIPPRVKIRENALLELPHIMLLLDDDEKSVIESVTESGELNKIYDFELMENSGSIKGYKLSVEQVKQVMRKLSDFSDREYFERKYSVQGKSPLVFAVGDGNHSLATAKACYENLKRLISPDKAKLHPARYALVELVNLHDDSLEFEAIHRVLFKINPEHLLSKFGERFKLQFGEVSGAQTLTVVIGGAEKKLSILNPDHTLTVGTLQRFLDNYLQENSGTIDYIHGEDVVRKLCNDKQNIGFILPCMRKSDLFKSVINDGALPRKTFSMGEACDKRFYFEARKIR